jgi:hypothetical protein
VDNTVIERKKAFDFYHLIRRNIMNTENTENTENTPFIIGEKYFLRTATYHTVGRLKAMYPDFFVLSQASFVADSGLWHNALKDGVLSEVEPFIDDAIISRGGLIDATKWHHDLPTTRK